MANKVIYEKDGRIGRITLNRPEVMNAIDDDVPVELADCVARANADRRGPRHRAGGSRRGVLRRLRSDLLRARQRRHGCDPGDALGPDEGLRLHDAQHRAVHELVALLPAGDLQGARLRGRRRIGYRALRRHHRHEHRRPDRLYADAGVGMPDDGDVGLSPGPGTGEAHALHRRQDHRQSRRRISGSSSRPCRPRLSTPRSRRSPSAWRPCRSTSS